MERSCVRSHHSGHRCCGTRHLVRPRRVNPARWRGPATLYGLRDLGTGPQVAFLKSSPALPDWSLPVPGLRTPVRLTSSSFPELRPTVQTTSGTQFHPARSRTLGRLKAIWPQRRGPLRITAPNQSRRPVPSAAREAFPAPSASLRPPTTPREQTFYVAVARASNGTVRTLGFCRCAPTTSRKSALIPNDPARSLSAPRTQGGAP
jgi:hypothetical protein